MWISLVRTRLSNCNQRCSCFMTRINWTVWCWVVESIAMACSICQTRSLHCRSAVPRTVYFRLTGNPRVARIAGTDLESKTTTSIVTIVLTFGRVHAWVAPEPWITFTSSQRHRVAHTSIKAFLWTHVSGIEDNELVWTGFQEITASKVKHCSSV